MKTSINLLWSEAVSKITSEKENYSQTAMLWFKQACLTTAYDDYVYLLEDFKQKIIKKYTHCELIDTDPTINNIYTSIQIAYQYKIYFQGRNYVPILTTDN